MHFACEDMILIIMFFFMLWDCDIIVLNVDVTRNEEWVPIELG